MYQTILKKFSQDGIYLNAEQQDFLKEFVKVLPQRTILHNFFTKDYKHGCYLHGGVGRGKTMVLNLVFEEIKHKKCSFHFIEFMKFIHIELELVKKTKDPLVKVAKKIASKYEVILVEEFQVEDFSDAMIIG